MTQTSLPVRAESRHTRDHVDRYLEKLPAGKRKEIESEAMSSASGFLLETLEAEEEGPLAEECRNLIVKAFLSERLGTRDS